MKTSKMFALASVLALVSGAMIKADSTAIDKLNKEIKNGLVDYNNETTKAQLTFRELESNKKRAIALSLKALYEKTGKYNKIKLDIADVSYSYPEEAEALPTVKVRAMLATDFTKILPREQIDEMAKDLEEMLREESKSALDKYGAAAKLTISIDEKNVDENGHIVSIAGGLRVKIDFKKLPANLPADEVEFSDAQLKFELGINGGGVRVKVTMNPKHRSFLEDQRGLKELIDGLLSGETKELREALEIIGYLDRFAEDLVNRKP